MYLKSIGDCIRSRDESIDTHLDPPLLAGQYLKELVRIWNCIRQTLQDSDSNPVTFPAFLMGGSGILRLLYLIIYFVKGLFEIWLNNAGDKTNGVQC